MSVVRLYPIKDPTPEDIRQHKELKKGFEEYLRGGTQTMTDKPKGGLYFGEHIVKNIIDVLENGSRIERKRLAAQIKQIAAWPGEVKEGQEG